MTNAVCEDWLYWLYWRRPSNFPRHKNVGDTFSQSCDKQCVRRTWRVPARGAKTFPVDCVWNVMAHAQKPDFGFRRNGRAHLNRQGASAQSTTGSRGVCSSGSNVGYTMFRGSFSGFPFTSPLVRHRVPSRFNWTLRKTLIWTAVHWTATLQHFL
jgi:hypothetical protein